jgi:hypothetical protein
MLLEVIARILIISTFPSIDGDNGFKIAVLTFGTTTLIS